ncbi:MAG TPA: SusC/RagA family TonB-linked outer membrane protein [Algoriphagus sp.]|jgi:TonB-linked SusC/RagA family outer membrane protein|uniref:SusC/RagA family TonB-linked outer membrane protein n=3 Tax=Algoriphagus TaxID=246875 RepID=UPI000C3C403A|nr:MULTISPECIES: TonB-dependent receptor [unclassified Algoriphagus]MAL14740.1 SusC/RagA family TonB-linked outer membrane protein [Algoriphagus sp.]HCD87164.1 SusC/RagA family TonB-linked outer membrane protein [Algoriphagus sp.]
MRPKFYTYLTVVLFLLLGVFQAKAQDQQVSGTVSDETGYPLPGVTILLKGTTRGTTSDLDGKYSISAPSTGVLVFSFIGYDPKEVTVGNQTTINVSLNPDLSDLEEVIVVGYGTAKKSQLTGAISSVGNKEIQELPITDARQALQGRAAGVDVTQPGSKPGSPPQVRIRGRRSFNASNEPLYVVDGIPIVGGLDDINPQDITSMEVLKDASATAIYGSRGANGVVLITTKRGTKGKTVVSLDSYYGINEELGRIEVFDGPAFAEYKRESRRATGNYPEGPATPEADANIFEPVELESLAMGRSTDYIGGLLRTGAIQSHQIGVSGGSDKTTFFVSANYFNDKGVVINQDFSRYTFRVNIDHQINDKFKIGTSTLVSYSERNGEDFNPLGGALQENPLGKPFDDEGNLIFLPTSDGLRTNPFAEVVPGAQVDLTKRYRIFNSIYANWQIAEGLTYRFVFGPDFNIARSGRFTGSQTNARRGGAATGSVNERFRFNYTLENILTYTKKFNQDHNINITALQSIQKDNFEQTTVSVLGIPAESQLFHRLGDASQITGANTNLVQWALMSFMGRVNYDYKNKLLLTGTVRADGSSRFGENNRYGVFPSVAVGWNLSEEAFLKNSSSVDQLKLRVSYGSIGNQAINPYQTQALLGRTTYAFDNTPAFGYRPNSIGNPDLRWETSTTFNTGVDFALWKGRVIGALEYYVTNTSDLLAPQPLPNSTGFGGFITNIGETQNRGIELTLSTLNVEKGDFTWSTDLIFTRNREEIISLPNGDDIAAGRFIGRPLTVFYDLKKVGIWQLSEADVANSFGDVPGEIKVEDFNGDGRINADDRQFLGSAVPDFSIGMTNRFAYKGFDFNFFIFGRFGSMIRSAFHDNFNTLFGRYNNLAVNYWTPNNPTNDYPRPNQNQERPKYNTSMSYFSGTFVKVRNINFGYTFSQEAVKKIGLQSLRVYSSIQQPFIFSEYRTKHKGIDPEVFIDGEQGVEGGVVNANISPAVTQFTFGINAKF